MGSSFIHNYCTLQQITKTLSKFAVNLMTHRMLQFKNKLRKPLSKQVKKIKSTKIRHDSFVEQAFEQIVGFGLFDADKQPYFYTFEINFVCFVKMHNFQFELRKFCQNKSLFDCFFCKDSFKIQINN